MKDAPEDFVNNLVVYYSLQTQDSSKRSITIKAEHCKSGKLFTRLQQNLPGKDTVYMTSDDMKQMTMEMSTNVMASSVQDADFISNDQSLQISTLLETIMQAIPASTETFDKGMWDSVFWNDENARPDTVAEEMNEIYNHASDEERQQMSSGSSSEHTLGVKVDASLSATGGEDDKGPKGTGTVGVGVEKGDKSSKSDSLDKYKKLEKQNSGKTEWKGNKIVPKALNLTRANVAAFHSSTAIATTQVSVTKTTSELSSRINIVHGWHSKATPARHLTGKAFARAV